MKWVSLVGAMVLIGLVDWVVVWALRKAVKLARRGLVRLWG
jgi:hypothetical protein